MEECFKTYVTRKVNFKIVNVTDNLGQKQFLTIYLIILFINKYISKLHWVIDKVMQKHHIYLY